MLKTKSKWQKQINKEEKIKNKEKKVNIIFNISKNTKHKT